MMFVCRLVAFSSMTLVQSGWTRTAFVVHHRLVHLPSQKLSSADDETNAQRQSSVTGPIYDMSNGPTVKLFTKEGCTLCDKVKDVRAMICW